MTRVEALDRFYPAEDYHQDYLLNHPDQPYIVFHDLPKVRNFAKLMPALYQGKPVTVAAARAASRAAPAANARRGGRRHDDDVSEARGRRRRYAK